MAAFREVLSQSLLIFLFIGSLTGLVVGIGLIVRSQRTLAFFRSINTWVSTRSAMKTVEIPRTVGRPLADSKRRWATGLLFVIGGLYAALLLAENIGVSSAVLFRAGRSAPLFAILLDSLRWFLLIGCCAGVVIGVMLLFFPGHWAGVEAWANRWHSTRRLAAGGEVQYHPLDRWVERSPRTAGTLVAVGSAVALGAFGILLRATY